MEVSFPLTPSCYIRCRSAQLCGTPEDPSGRAPASICNGAELVAERKSSVESYMLAAFVWMGLISSAHIHLPEKGVRACLSSTAMCLPPCSMECSSGRGKQAMQPCCAPRHTALFTQPLPLLLQHWSIIYD